MEDKDNKGCCDKKGCGLRCYCCACMAIKAVVLLLVGGAIGYFIGR
ncbi:MAG: hypothetical protein AABZ44_09295 [Elusimicrobiota bacterium]